MERIVAAAIRQDGVVYTGPHHHQIIRYVAALLKIRPVDGEQGFVTNQNRFVNRNVARKIASHAHQVYGNVGELFSEQLWEIRDEVFMGDGLEAHDEAIRAECAKQLPDLMRRCEADGCEIGRRESEQKIRALEKLIAQSKHEGSAGRMAARILELEAQLAEANQRAEQARCEICRRPDCEGTHEGGTATLIMALRQDLAETRAKLEASREMYDANCEALATRANELADAAKAEGAREERERADRAVKILSALLYASDQCIGHRMCGHSMQPWKDAREFLSDPAESAKEPEPGAHQ